MRGHWQPRAICRAPNFPYFPMYSARVAPMDRTPDKPTAAARNLPAAKERKYLLAIHVSSMRSEEVSLNGDEVSRSDIGNKGSRYKPCIFRGPEHACCDVYSQRIDSTQSQRYVGKRGSVVLVGSPMVIRRGW